MNLKKNVPFATNKDSIEEEAAKLELNYSDKKLKDLIVILFKYFHTPGNTSTIPYITGSNAFKITFNRIRNLQMFFL